MRAIVVYSSKTGFTLKYAKKLSEDLNCELLSIKEIKTRNWDKDEIVIYGGSLKAGLIRDLSHFNKTVKVNPDRLIVFACGLTSREDQVKIQEIKKANHLENSPFYYFPGGVDYSRLGFASRSLLKMICKSIKKDPQKDQMMAKRLEKSGDYTELDLLEEMIEQIKSKSRFYEINVE